MKETPITIDGFPLTPDQSAAVRYAINNLILDIREGAFEDATGVVRAVMHDAAFVQFLIARGRAR